MTYLTTFTTTLASGYRMRRRIKAGRCRAAYWSLLDAWDMTTLLWWMKRRPGPEAE